MLLIVDLSFFLKKLVCRFMFIMVLLVVDLRFWWKEVFFLFSVVLSEEMRLLRLVMIVF